MGLAGGCWPCAAKLKVKSRLLGLCWTSLWKRLKHSVVVRFLTFSSALRSLVCLDRRTSCPKLLNSSLGPLLGP